MTNNAAVRKLVSALTLDELKACLHAGAPPLPWRGADGTEACSFIAIRRPPDPPLVLFLDCHGEVISTLASGADDPIVKTVMNCRPAFGQVIFLPSVQRR